MWRVNLSEGRFYTPLDTKDGAANVCAVGSELGLLAVGGEEGGVQCFDMREKRSVGYLPAAQMMGTVSI